MARYVLARDGITHLPAGSPEETARARCEHLSPGERHSFMSAFLEARSAAYRGGDLELLWRAVQPYDAAVAGHIEGVASVRAEELP